MSVRNYCQILLIAFGSLIGHVLSENCNETNLSIACRESRVMKNTVHFIRNPYEESDTKTPSSLTIVPGLEIVEVPNGQQDLIDARANDIDDTHDVDGSFIGQLIKYMRTHELKIKLSDLLDKTDYKDAISVALKGIDDGKDLFEGRKKDKGMGVIIMMGLMMGKMMTALGLGGVGALALKALAVSSLALLLAGIIGIKKLTDGNGDNRHKRRRRSINQDLTPLPYRGWTYLAVN